MSESKIELNSAGVRALLCGPEIQADLARRAHAIAARAGDGFEVRTSVGANRARAVVFTDTFDAMREEATHRTLTKALDAGRG